MNLDVESTGMPLAVKVFCEVARRFGRDLKACRSVAAGHCCWEGALGVRGGTDVAEIEVGAAPGAERVFRMVMGATVPSEGRRSNSTGTGG